MELSSQLLPFSILADATSFQFVNDGEVDATLPDLTAQLAAQNLTSLPVVVAVEVAASNIINPLDPFDPANYTYGGPAVTSVVATPVR